jgi:threonine dehydratase
LVTIEDIREAAKGLVGVIEPTPLVPATGLEVMVGHPVYLKLENKHATGAFKMRGAVTAIRRLSPELRRAGVLTYSSGNHGQALAFAAHRMGIRAVIVMPETAPATKVEGVERWGGETVFAGTTSEHRYVKGLEIAEAEGLTVIPPFDHPDIIAGQGTAGLEIVEQLPEVAHVVFPVGGGGLGAGVTTALSALRPEAKLTGVEPEGAASFGAAVRAGHPVLLDQTESIADGLLTLSVGTITFKHLRGRADAVTVSEEAIAQATVWLRGDLGVMAEPSGAVTTAAIRTGTIHPKGPTVLIVSGGNADKKVLESLAKFKS